jgi:hypothetical protein
MAIAAGISCSIGFLLFCTAPGFAEGQNSGSRGGERVHVILTRDFYNELRNAGGSGGRTYSNDKSHEYLRQISVSSKFMVETNFQILKQQEKIIQLLESLSKHSAK